MGRGIWLVGLLDELHAEFDEGAVEFLDAEVFIEGCETLLDFPDISIDISGGFCQDPRSGV